MESLVELVLDNWGALELSSDVNIPLTFDVNNVKDISSRNGVYSKTIQIHGNNNNNNNTILAQAFDVNVQSQTFDIKKKEPFRLIREGQVVMEGVFQLRKIHKKYENGNFLIKYDCYIKSEASSFFNIIDGKYLTDIYVGDLNHVMSEAEVLRSMQQGQEKDGYQYFLTYNDDQFNIFRPNELRPAIYTKTYFDRLIDDAGYYYTPPIFNTNGDLINEPSFPELFDIDFDKLIIPFNGDKLKPAIEENLKFKAGIDGLPDVGKIGKNYEQIINNIQIDPLYTAQLANSVQGSPVLSTTVPNDYLVGDIIRVTDNVLVIITLIVDNTTFIADYYIGNTLVNGTYTIQRLNLLTASDYDIVYFNDNNPSQGWVQLPPPLYDTVLGEYDAANIIQPTVFQAKGSVTIDWSIFGGFTPSDNIKLVWNQFLPPDFTIEFKATIAVFDNNNTFLGSIVNPQKIAELNFSGDDTYSNSDIITADVEQFDINGLYVPSQFFNQGAILKVLVFAEFIGGRTPIFQRDGTTALNERNGLRVSVGMIPGGNDKNFFTNISEVDIVDGALIDMSSAIPKNVKQSHFVGGLARMFNLYIKEDRLDPKKLVIKTRDRWYADGENLDWTDKLDITSVDVEPISHSLQKIKKFHYKNDDKDVALKTYSDQTSEVFGEQTYIFGNEFINGESKVEPIFSPTIQIHNIGTGFAMNVPFINKKSPKNNIRILYVGDVLFNYWQYQKEDGTIGGIELPQGNVTYRHVGHLFPNSRRPTKDLNYGISQFYAHNYEFLTNNNLYNRFYFKQFDIFENGYMMKAKFKLNSLDILNLNLDETIYVYDHYWNINRIIDFDPSKNGLTEVELISANGKLGDFTPNNRIVIQQSSSIQNEINQKSLTDTKNNKYGDGVNNTKIIGNNNVAQAKSNTNLFLGNDSIIDGNNNFVKGNKVDVRGNNITGLNANGLILDQEDVVSIGRMVEVIHVIDGGSDNVLDYPDGSVINVIDSGSDDILPLGTFKIQNLIDGGENRVL